MLIKLMEKMKMSRLIWLLICAVFVLSCNPAKKSTSSAASEASAPKTNTNPSSDSYLFTKPAAGIHPPASEELSALQIRYKDITMEKLKEGYKIYTQGACIGCHTAQNIYNYGEEQWKLIIDDMSFRANITDEQKDAVLKYVLAIKATQPK
jgi:hypothetical protein